MGSNVMAVFLDEYLFMNPKAFPSIFPTTATGMNALLYTGTHSLTRAQVHCWS